MNNNYQKTTNKVSPTKEKNSTIWLLLERPINKTFETPDLEIQFLIDSGAETIINSNPTWNETRNRHPKHLSNKTYSKLATAQGTSLTTFGKIQLSLIPTRTMEQKIFFTKTL